MGRLVGSCGFVLEPRYCRACRYCRHCRWLAPRTPPPRRILLAQSPASG